MTIRLQGSGLAVPLVALSLTGCLGKTIHPWTPAASLLARRPTLPVLAALEPPPRTPELALGPPRPARKSLYQVRELSFASSGNNRQPENRVQGRYFQSTLPGRRPLVIVLPIWGASDYPAKTTMRHLTSGDSAGRVHVLLLRGERYLFDWEALGEAGDEAAFLRELDVSMAAYRATVRDVRSLVDWARRRREVDGSRLGIIGFSMSSILGTLVMAVDGRISAGVFVMGGGNLDEIFATCPSHPGSVRVRVRSRFGWSRERFRAVVASAVEDVNPVRYAGRVDPRSVLLIQAADDECIPPGARSALWQALGRPELVEIRGGHKRAFLSMTALDRRWTTRRIVDFFTRRFFGESSLERPSPVTTAGALGSGPASPRP